MATLLSWRLTAPSAVVRYVVAECGKEAKALRSRSIARFAERLERDRDLELREALTQIACIARFRLETLLGNRASMGAATMPSREAPAAP